MHLPGGANAMACYVGLTRVKKLERLLIYRPFDRQPFCKGSHRNRALLLTKLRGDIIGWSKIEQDLMPRK